MTEGTMPDFVRKLKDSMQQDFEGTELEGFNIAMKTITKWADHDGEDWGALADALGSTAAGITNGDMALGFNSATSAFQGALFALEYAGAV